VLCFKALAIEDETHLSAFGSSLGVDTNFMSVLAKQKEDLSEFNLMV
jgi:hypothetical protein